MSVKEEAKAPIIGVNPAVFSRHIEFLAQGPADIGPIPMTLCPRHTVLEVQTSHQGQPSEALFSIETDGQIVLQGQLLAVSPLLARILYHGLKAMQGWPKVDGESGQPLTVTAATPKSQK